MDECELLSSIQWIVYGMRDGVNEKYWERNGTIIKQTKK